MTIFLFVCPEDSTLRVRGDRPQCPPLLRPTLITVPSPVRVHTSTSVFLDPQIRIPSLWVPLRGPSLELEKTCFFFQWTTQRLSPHFSLQLGVSPSRMFWSFHILVWFGSVFISHRSQYLGPHGSQTDPSIWYRHRSPLTPGLNVKSLPLRGVVFCY